MRKTPLRKAPLIDPFEVSFSACENTVRAGLRAVMDHLAPLALDVGAAGAVELVLAEALNNIVEHALVDAAGDCEIHMRCSHATDGLHIVLIDPGKPMPDHRAPAGTPPAVEVPIDELPEGGFGWFMIHTLARDVTYARKDGANHLCLRIAIGD